MYPEARSWPATLRASSNTTSRRLATGCAFLRRPDRALARNNRSASVVDDDVSNQGPKQHDSFENIIRGDRAVRERHLRVERAEEFLCMSDVADAVHVRVLHFSGALPPGKPGEIRHEPLDEAFEERHGDDNRDRR